ncbi:hypothetical protein KY348_04035 [Candidatus Woesearchaeota archaeon]|nr:hypothetical protein [Candidatus Woesearchaeota archaeon]
MEKSLIDEVKFRTHHKKQVHHRSQKDIFFIWMIIVFISVISAHFVLNFTGSTPTGFVTATQNTMGNVTLLLGALLVVFVIVLITGVIYVGITRKDL